MFDKLLRRVNERKQPQKEEVRTLDQSPSPAPARQPPKVKKERKKRSDAGRHLITDRDKKAFAWVGEMMIVRLDHLAILLWRYGHRRDLQRHDGTLSLNSAREVVEKWKSRGLAESYKFFADEVEYVWLTLEGQRVAGLPYRKKFGGKRGLLTHYCAVNSIRLYLEKLYGTQVEWISERRIRYDRKQGHIPDGIVIYQDQRAAIEAELSTKNKRTSLEDMRQLARDYDNIWFFADVRERGRVERTIGRLSTEERQSFAVYDMKEVA